MPLAGRPMIEWSLEALRACEAVRRDRRRRPARATTHGLGGQADLGVVAGGATRAQSVANALEAVETELSRSTTPPGRC